MAAMSAKTECDPKTVEVEKESLSTEEKSMFELYQSWRLDEEQPGIIQYMLDFGRNHLDLGPTELEIPETEAESMTQDINAPAAPEEPETLGRASIDKPLTRALGSIPEETREEVKQASNGRSQPERRVKPAMASRQIQKRSKSRPAAPVVKASAQTKETPQPSPPQQLEKDPQDEQNGQKDQTEEDARTVNGEGWIRLAPKIPSSMTPHSVPLQRQTTLQVVPGMSQSPFTRAVSPPALKGATRPLDSPPPPDTQPKTVRTVEQITLRRGVVINTEPLAVQIRLVGTPPPPQPAAQEGAARPHPPVNTRRQNNENREPTRRSVRRR